MILRFYVQRPKYRCYQPGKITIAPLSVVRRSGRAEGLQTSLPGSIPTHRLQRTLIWSAEDNWAGQQEAKLVQLQRRTACWAAEFLLQVQNLNISFLEPKHCPKKDSEKRVFLTQTHSRSQKSFRLPDLELCHDPLAPK